MVGFSRGFVVDCHPVEVNHSGLEGGVRVRGGRVKVRVRVRVRVRGRGRGRDKGTGRGRGRGRGRGTGKGTRKGTGRGTIRGWESGVAADVGSGGPAKVNVRSQGAGNTGVQEVHIGILMLKS